MPEAWSPEGRAPALTQADRDEIARQLGWSTPSGPRGGYGYTQAERDEIARQLGWAGPVSGGGGSPRSGYGGGSSGDGSGGGGGGGSYTVAQQNEIAAQLGWSGTSDIDATIRQQYPAFAYLLDHPEIGPLLRQAASEGWDATRLQASLYATNWWKTTAETTRQWDTLVHVDPASAERRRYQRGQEVLGELRRLGINVEWNPLMAMIEDSLRLGWSQIEITNSLINYAATDYSRLDAGGQVRATADQLGQMARSYLLPMAPNDLLAQSLRVNQNQATTEGIRAAMIAQARTRFANDAAVQASLDAGLTLADHFAPIVNTVAGELEMAPAHVDLMDQRWSQLVSHTAEDQTIRPMTQSEAISWARHQSEWDTTRNAQEAYAGLADAVTQKWALR